MKIGIFPRGFAAPGAKKVPRAQDIPPPTQAIDKAIQALKTTKQNHSATNVSSVTKKWLPAGNEYF